MQKVIEWIVSHPLTGLIVFTGIIQIVPIKINPWSALFKWIGSMITGNIRGKIDDLIKQVEENEKDRIRWEVLDFANSCRNGRKHTRDEYQHIVALRDKYEKLLEKTHDSNGVFDVEYKYIQELYAERLEKNDFL
jgi:hypothetical protein